MYLFVYLDGRTRQVHDNLSVQDFLAIKQKDVKVYTVKDNKFLEIIIDENKICFKPVAEARVLQSTEGRIHHI